MRHLSDTVETPSVVRRLWKSVLGLGALALIVGAVVLIWPGQSLVVAGAMFGVYLLLSGIAQVIAAFSVYTSAASRFLLFITGALSIVLGVVAFRDFNDGAAMWLLATWIGVGSIFQGVASTALAISYKPFVRWGRLAGVNGVGLPGRRRLLPGFEGPSISLVLGPDLEGSRTVASSTPVRLSDSRPKPPRRPARLDGGRIGLEDR